jgi:hypothetical protein
LDAVYALSHAKSKADFKKRGGAYFSAGLNVMYGMPEECCLVGKW